MTRPGPNPLVTALTLAAFGFVAAIVLTGKTPEEGANPVASLVSKYVVVADRR